MDANIVTAAATVLNMATATLSTVVAAHATFRRSNIEEYFRLLIQEKAKNSSLDLSSFSKREDLQRFLFAIIDEVSVEAEAQKLLTWKNATVHIATDYAESDHKANFIFMLRNLSVVDLKILDEVYSHQKGLRGPKLSYWSKTESPEDKMQRTLESDFRSSSLKKLASMGLLSERFLFAQVFEEIQKPLVDAINKGLKRSQYLRPPSDASEFEWRYPITYSTNHVGSSFLKFIEDLSAATSGKSDIGGKTNSAIPEEH